MSQQTIKRARPYAVDDETARKLKNRVPRCPFCNTVLDFEVDPGDDGYATFTLTDRSAGHVAAPHRERISLVLLEVVP